MMAAFEDRGCRDQIVKLDVQGWQTVLSASPTLLPNDFEAQSRSGTFSEEVAMYEYDKVLLQCFDEAPLRLRLENETL